MTAELRTVALLPMKANSERVKGKNFRLLGGKPLFRWMLDVLLTLPEIDRIVINTDARAELEACGLPETDRIQVRDRRPEICGDLVSMNRVIDDDVEAVPAATYLMTHATNPLLSAETVRDALRAFRGATQCDSLFTVNRVQARFYRADATPVNHDPDDLIRTQDLEPWFEENSCLYIFTKASFAATGARIGRHPHLFVTPRLESLDIDDAEDWDLAQALIEARAQR